MQNFMFLAIGIGALLVALALTLVLLRLNRTLFVLEALLETMTAEMRETLPEVRAGLGNVNEIAEGVNVAMRSAGTGLERFNGRLKQSLRERALDLAAAWHGLRVASETYAAQQAAAGQTVMEAGISGASGDGEPAAGRDLMIAKEE